MGRIRPLPRPVENTKGDQKTYGTVIDEVKHLESYPDDEDFLDLIQLIEWEDGRRSIRICYYVKPHDGGDDDWTYANRPIILGPDVMKELLTKASKKGWFKDVLP